MKRRLFLKSSSSALLLISLSTSLIPSGAFAAECEFTKHLKGFIPEGANVALSSTGQFHHFHYLHVPQSILENPPEGGWSTITSLMSPDLGIDDFFYRNNEIRKQFHCHQVYFSNGQINRIANGEEVIVTAYIQGSNGPRPNHTFIFNPTKTLVIDGDVEIVELPLNEIEDQVREVAIAQGYGMERSPCDTIQHLGVSVFNSKGRNYYTDINDLENLKGYTDAE